MTFAIALNRHVQVILALLAHEEEMRRKHPVDSILHLLEPIFLIGTMTLFWWILGRNKSAPFGDSIVLFYATGFVPLYYFIYISRRMASNIDRPRNRYPVEQRLDHIIVHIILRIVDYSILGFFVFGAIYMFISKNGLPHDLTPVVEACVAITMLGFGWGVIVILISKIHWTTRMLVPRLSRGLILFSGIFYIPDYLAPNVREWLAYNPMLHAINLFRHGFYYRYPSLLLDTHYLFYSSIIAVVLGLALERVTRRREAA
jgi:capsular polysaccharide transport system permease protein